jgi:DHA2 family multidrug resistance protein-like MFS transporter
LQHGPARDVLQIGLLMTPWPLAVALVAPLAGRLANRISGAWLCALGGVSLATGLAFLTLCPLDARPWLLVGCVALCGAGFGLFQVSNNRNMFLSAPRARSGAAGGMQGTARLTGQTIGALTMTLVFTLTSIDVAPRIGFGIAAVLTLLAGLVSILRAPAVA